MRALKHLPISVFAVLLGFVTPLQAARDALLTNRENIAVPASASKPLTATDVRRAITGAAAHRGWSVIHDSPGKMRLQLDDKKGKYQLIVEAVYDEKRYSLKYVTSTGLRYKEEGGARYIHSSYGRWMDNLVQSINTELALAQI
jgi:hypothetical protein